MEPDILSISRVRFKNVIISLLGLLLAAIQGQSSAADFYCKSDLMWGGNFIKSFTAKAQSHIRACDDSETACMVEALALNQAPRPPGPDYHCWTLRYSSPETTEYECTVLLKGAKNQIYKAYIHTDTTSRRYACEAGMDQCHIDLLQFKREGDFCLVTAKGDENYVVRTCSVIRKTKMGHWPIAIHTESAIGPAVLDVMAEACTRAMAQCTHSGVPSQYCEYLPPATK